MSAARKQGWGWAWAVFVTVLLLAPESDLAPKPTWIPEWLLPFADKVVHALLFAVQSVLWTPPSADATTSRRAALAAFGLGTVLELAQSLVPGRVTSIGDLLANGVGALVGAVWSRRSARRR